MTPQELKNSILQLAIQGKLVPQRAEEGSAEELYKQIQAEKKKLIKEKKIKKEKLLPEITDEEKPFDIPETWKWVRLGEIVGKNISRGKSPQYVLKSNVVAFAQKCNTKAGFIDLSLAKFIDEKMSTKYNDIEFLKDNDIIINSTGTGTLGRVGIFKDIDNPNKFIIIPDSHVTIVRISNLNDYNYMFYCLKSYQSFFEKNADGSTKQKELKPDIIKNTLIPLPPLAEQKRIAARIKELLKHVEQYEKAYNELQELDKRFPGDLQKSILQLAIQGRLVPQRAEEGSAEELYKQIQAEKKKLIKEKKIKKEKLLPEITDEEKPFDIPETWKWVRLGEIVGKNISRGKSPQYVLKSNVVAFAQKCNTKAGFIDLSLAKFIDEKMSTKYNDIEFLKDNDIIINSTGTGTLGRVGIFKDIDNPNKFIIIPDSHVTIVRISNLNDYNYMFYCLKSYQSFFEKNADGSTKQKELKPDIIKNTLIPLPPLAEQKRIAARIKELLPLCEKLKN